MILDSEDLNVHDVLYCVFSPSFSNFSWFFFEKLIAVADWEGSQSNRLCDGKYPEQGHMAVDGSLLNAGTKQPLEAADVPLLGASDLTLTVYRKLQSKWLQQEESSRSLGWEVSEEARGFEECWKKLCFNFHVHHRMECILTLVGIHCCFIATFILYISLNGQLIEPGKAFTAVATFSILQEPIRVFPEALMAITQALVSVQRLKKFMQSDELQDDAVEQQVYLPGLEAETVAAVCVEDGCFKWELDLELPALNHINIKIEKGSFVGIVGMVGSGKFTIPASLLGEVPRITGRVWSLELLLWTWTCMV